MRAVLVVAHGSGQTDLGSAAELHSRTVSRERGIPCYHGYLEYQEPGLHETLNRMVADGVTEAAIVPLFFARSFFSDYVVPKLVGLPNGLRVGTVSRAGGSLRISVAGTFGEHPMMRGVMEDAVMGLSPEDAAILLIGHGSMDGSSLRTVEMNADILRGMGFRTFSCFNEMQEPDVQNGLETAMTSGKPHIHVIPMFVSPSFHTMWEIPDILGIPRGETETEKDGIRITYAREIGMHPGVAEIVSSLADDAFGKL